MHDDLRRRALESGKTVSRKAKGKSGQSSPRGSKPASNVTSRNGSRIQSRDVSDDEDGFGGGNLSDDTTQSINSIDALLESDDFNEQTTDAIKEELRAAIEDLLDRKGSSTSSRETSLSQYVRALTAHYLADVLYGKVPELLNAFSKSIKAETSPKESTLALRAVSLTAITIDYDDLYDTMSALLRRTVSDSQYSEIKAAAIHCLGICLSFGGAGDDEITDTLTFLLEIVSSDGSFVDAEDNVDVVAAAAQTYGFLATQIEDLEDDSEDAVAAFLEQLDSGSVPVQIACGEDIALLFEKSYTPREEDETASDIDDDVEDDGTPDSDEEDTRGDTSLVKRYNAYHNASEVLEKAQSLASLSTKSLNRNDKKHLHQAFARIVQTVQNPRVGLQSNNASRMTVKIHREGEMKVDKWWKLMRLNALRRLLGGGFVNHYFEGNKHVLDSLPMILRSSNEGSGTMSPRKGKPKASDRYRDQRRFVSATLDS